MTDWFVCYTTSGGERLAREDLQEWGYTAFLPMCVVRKRPARHRKNRKIQTKVEPLFPRYLFVAFPTGWHDFEGVRRSRRIHDFLRDAWGTPIRIRAEVVEGIMADMSMNRSYEASQKALREAERMAALSEQAKGLTPGQRFQWQEGLFKGFMATVVEVAKRHVKVAVDNGQGATLTLDVALDKIAKSGLLSHPEGDQQKQCAQLGSSSVGRPEE